MSEGLLTKKIKMDEDDDIAKNCQSSSTEQSTCETGPTIGKRIIDIEHMAKQMYCSACNTALLLQNIEDESLKGLASIFKVRCHECSTLNSVISSKHHKDPSTGRTLFDINTKAALGVMHVNIELTQMNKFLSVVNVPNLSYNLYKIHENIVGSAIKEAAEKNCTEVNCKSKREISKKYIL